MPCIKVSMPCIKVSGIDTVYHVSMQCIKVSMYRCRVSRYQVSMQCIRVSMPCIKVSGVDSRRCKLQFRFLITLLKTQKVLVRFRALPDALATRYVLTTTLSGNCSSLRPIDDVPTLFPVEAYPLDDFQWRLLLSTADWRRFNAAFNQKPIHTLA